MTRFLIVLWLVLGMAGPVLAAEEAPKSVPEMTGEATNVAIPPKRAEKAKFAPQSRDMQPMSLTIGKAEIIDLPRVAGEILIADAAIADARVAGNRRLYLMGRTAGDTTIFVFDPRGEVMVRLELHVHVDELTLRQTLKTVLPNEKITVQAVNRDIVLTGTPSSTAVAEQARRIARRFTANDESLIDLMNVQGAHQVLLRVRIAEVDRNALQELGVQTNFGNGIQQNNSLDFVFSAAQAIGLTASPFGAASLLFSPGGFGPINLIMNALERDGLVHVLAEPNLTAVSGETARFLVGGEIPVPVAQESGQVTIEFRPIGVSLSFTPTVMSEDRISLRLGTEVSSTSEVGAIVSSGLQIPGISSRRAETVVEMGSGGSLMIAGLIQSRTVNGLNGLPGLKDTPILSRLFQSDSFRREETEVIMIVTAMLVKPYGEPVANRAERAQNITAALDLGLIEQMKQTYGADRMIGIEPNGQQGYIVE